MINVVIISPGFALNENDTVCLPFIQIYLLELLQNKNIHLRIITEQYPTQENYEWHGIKITTLQKKKTTVLDKLLSSFKLKRLLSKLNDETKINVVHHFWLSKHAAFSADFCKNHHIKHLITMAGQDVLLPNKFLNKAILNYSQLFCLSEFHLKKLHENSNLNAKVIEWGIEEITNKQQERTIDLIFCGWLNDIKNVPQFIEIVKRLNGAGLLKKVVMCGGGTGLNATEHKIKDLGLTELIELKGETPRNEVIILMQQSKILVHTSHFESFGLVLIEALACGCKVVSAPVGIAYNNTQMVSCQNIEDFVSQIQILLKQTNINYSNNYSIKNTVSEYLNVYSK